MLHHDVTPEQAAEAWAAYEAQMAEEADQAHGPVDVGKDED